MFKINQKNYFNIFILVCTLFLLWGFSMGLIDVLNKHFQEVLHISKARSGLVQFAYYMGYFIMAIPAGFFAKKFGYKGRRYYCRSYFSRYWFIMGYTCN